MSERRGAAGFTLIEAIFGMMVLSLALVAILTLIMADLTSVSQGKARALGLSLVNEQMEYLRDLPYDSLATATGTIYPPGTIPDDQILTRNNYKFRLHTEITYVDDPYDGNAAGTVTGKPTDLYPYDYKRAQITAFTVTGNRQMAQLTSDIGAKAAETASNTGILSVKVLDASGQPVPNASVHIVNPVPNPDVDITTTTDNNGLVVIPKLPPDANKNYQVTASLSGYSTDQTYPDPPGAQTPVNPNVNILVQQITNLTLAIDRTSALTVHATNTLGLSLPLINIGVTGAKKNFTNPNVFKYSTNQTADVTGSFTIANLEWDSYNFTAPAGYYIVTANPCQPAALNPNSSLTVNLVLSTSATYPTIASVTPNADDVGSNPSAVTITGTNLSGATFKLAKLGQSDIVATGITTSANSLSGNLNLTGVTTGAWDLVVTKSGNSATQPGGFNVTP